MIVSWGDYTTRLWSECGESLNILLIVSNQIVPAQGLPDALFAESP